MAKKPKRNLRRLENRHVLDVKLRTDDLRRRRTRLATSIGTAVFGTLFILFMAWRGVDWALDEFVYQNPAFRIRHIDARTDGILRPEVICGVAGVRVGQNLMALDLNRIKRNLERRPVVRSASVERLLPGQLRIRVVERVPVARVGLLRPDGRGGHQTQQVLLDGEGQWVDELHPSWVTDPRPLNYAALPVLQGVDETELGATGRVSSPQARAALRLLETFRQSPMAGVTDISRMQVQSPGVLTAATRDGGYITFSASGEFARQLARWRQIHDVATRAGKVISTLDLSITNNLPVHWQDAARPAAVPTGRRPPPVRANLSRSKNV